MSEEKKVGLSRREFLKDAGLVVGGATVGSMAFLGACGCDGDGITTTPVTETKYLCPFDDMVFSTKEALEAHFAQYHPNANNQNLSVFNVNGTNYAFYVKDTELLSTVLRDKLGFYGTKVACDMGECGSCTVLMDDIAVFSCLVLARECAGKRITTIEGLATAANTDVGAGHPSALSNVQQRFFEQDAFQCGYCTPGFIMAGAGLLKANPNPSYQEARIAVSGHACLCGNIKKVVDALTGNGGVS